MYDTLVFSPDGKHVAFAAKLGDKWSVALDGKEGKQYDGIITTFGGKITFDSATTLRYIAVEGGKVYLVEEKLREGSV